MMEVKKGKKDMRIGEQKENRFGTSGGGTDLANWNKKKDEFSGTDSTSSILKRNKEAEMEKKHAAEVNSLTDKVQEMVAKHEEMEAKHNKEMAAMEGKLHMLLKVMLNQRNSSLDVGDLVGILTTPHNDNNEVNHGCDEHLFDNSEEEEEEHLFDDLEEDEEYIV